MVKLNKIYTRTGDDGTTGLVGGLRVAKNDTLIMAIGDVDEANSAIGVALANPDFSPQDSGRASSEISAEASTSTRQGLGRIQNELFDLGADLATPSDTDHGFAPSDSVLRITAGQIARIEAEIDTMNVNLSPLASFVLPGGSRVAAYLHLARAICRRAERSAITATNEHELNPLALAYLNRLSDYLFVLCRFINAQRAGDILWEPGATR